MSARYVIPHGSTLSAEMSADWAGAVVSFQVVGATDGLPRVYRRFMGIEIEVPQFGKNEWRFNGPCSQVRVDYSLMSGFSSIVATIWRNGEPVPMQPEGVAAGTRATVSQSYNETNVKNGLQYFFHRAWPTAGPLGNGPANASKILFSTGIKPVLFKGRVFDYVGEELTIQLFRSPTGVTGGTAVNIRNFNDINPRPTTVTITRDVVTASNGVEISDPEYFYGSVNAPQRQAASIPIGRERVLRPFTDYLIVVTSVVGTARAQYFGDWFEGSPDLPLTL